MSLHVVDALAQERAKYEEIWSIPEYKAYSPGMENVERFIEVLDPRPCSSILDAGCGTGVAGLEFESRGFLVGWLDITDAGLDERVDRSRFHLSALWDVGVSHQYIRWDYGFCCDVMEHIPVEFTMLVAARLLDACRTVWFQIAYKPDAFGRVIGQPLHLTVMPHQWWLVRLSQVGKVVDARDLCGVGMFVLEQP